MGLYRFGPSGPKTHQMQSSKLLLAEEFYLKKRQWGVADRLVRMVTMVGATAADQEKASEGVSRQTRKFYILWLKISYLLL